jgi:hypothetical protein
MLWAKLVGFILSFMERASAYFQEKQLLEAGRREAEAEVLQENQDVVKKAIDARTDTITTIVREPDRLRDDDGFKRPD